MKLEKIKIHNLFQYEDLEITFNGNLVGIVGKNGTGKSNFLNSLHFAFAGEVPGKTKEQVLRWGEEEGYAIVEFNHAGKHGRIERHTPGTKASFKYGDEKAVTGIRQVNEAVLNMLGMDKDVFRLVFVKQAELDSILFDQTSRREVAFQRMCGLGEANRLYKNLSDLVAKVFSESAGDVEAAIATLNQEKENSEKELVEVDDSIRAFDGKIAKFGSSQDLASNCSKWKTAARLKFAMQQSNVTLAEKISVCENLKSELAKLADSVVGETVAANAKLVLQSEENKLRETEIAEKTIATAKQRMEANQLTVNSVRAESEEYKNLDALEAEAEAEARRLAEGRALADLYKAAINAVSMQGYPVCPLCGQTFPADLVQTFSAKLAACHTDGGHYQVMLDSLNAQKRKASELSGKLSTLLGMIDTDAKWLAEHPSIGSENLEAMRSNFAEMKEFVNDMTEKLNQSKQLEWKIRQIESDIGTLRAEYANNQRELDNLGISDSEVSYREAEEQSKKADELMEQFNKCVSEKNAALSVKTSLERRIIGIKQSLEDASRKLAQTSIRENAYRTLNKITDWLHYSNGPHKLAQRIMLDLTDDTNRFLETLGSPFSVSIDPYTLGYLFSMNDGSGPDAPMPAEALSGGQKVLLAVAFRLASYCMFAGKYGLLSLDEPTAYLDDANVANFCTLLESIKSTAVSMDLQILISTHERAVLPYMDSVLDIDAEKA